MRDQRGNLINLTRNPIALCRCGRSQTRPFCDGTHRSIRFQAPSELERDPTSGFQGGPHDAVVHAPPASETDRHATTAAGQHDLQSSSPVAQAALTRAARAADMIACPPAQRAHSLIAGALRLLDGAAASADRSASLLLIAGALEALSSGTIAGEAHGRRAVVELQTATRALEATS